MSKRGSGRIIGTAEQMAADRQDEPVEITDTPEIPSNAETATEATGEPVKKVESKADKFRRLAPKRVMKAVRALRAVDNILNKRVYEYTKEQQQKVILALWGELEKIELTITGGKKAEEEFTL